MQASHIQLSAIGDQSTRMETPLTGIPVNHVDSDGTPDTISVSGDHVTVVMHGKRFRLDVRPDLDAGFSGSTQVTVKVSDQSNPADHASTTFTLTVSGEASIFMNGFEN